MTAEGGIPRSSASGPQIPMDVYLAVPKTSRLPQCPDLNLEPSKGSLSAVEANIANALRTLWLEKRPNWVDPAWYQYPLSGAARSMTTKPAGPELMEMLAKQIPGRCGEHEKQLPEGSLERDAPRMATGRPCECLLVVLAAWEACAAWQGAQATQHLVAVMGSKPVNVPSAQAASVGLGALRDPAIEEIAIVWRASPSSVRNRLGNARMLTDHKDLLALVSAGAFPLWVLKRITTLLLPLPSETGQLISEALAQRIRARLSSARAPWTTSQLVGLAKRMVLELSPEDADKARRKANSFRYVSASSGDNGMSLIEALLPEVTVKEIMGHLTRTSRQLSAAGRDLDQMRADVFADLLMPGTVRCPSSSGPPVRSASQDHEPVGSSEGGSTCVCVSEVSTDSKSTDAGISSSNLDASPSTIAGILRDSATDLEPSTRPTCVSCAQDANAHGDRDSASGHSHAHTEPGCNVTCTDAGDAGTEPGCDGACTEATHAHAEAGTEPGRDGACTHATDAHPEAGSHASATVPMAQGTEPSASDIRESSDVPTSSRADAEPISCVTPSAGGSQIQVIVSMESLLGLTEHPGEIPGIGPISAPLARELAADGHWRAWLRNSAGAIVATSSDRYTPTRSVARIVRAREAYCRMPGCRVPSSACDLDHTNPWPAGATRAENLGPLCRRHHIMKTHFNWGLRTNPSQDSRLDMKRSDSGVGDCVETADGSVAPRSPKSKSGSGSTTRRKNPVAPPLPEFGSGSATCSENPVTPRSPEFGSGSATCSENPVTPPSPEFGSGPATCSENPVTPPSPKSGSGPATCSENPVTPAAPAAVDLSTPTTADHPTLGSQPQDAVRGALHQPTQATSEPGLASTRPQSLRPAQTGSDIPGAPLRPAQHSFTESVEKRPEPSSKPTSDPWSWTWTTPTGKECPF